ncbi:hypothetical protein K438DRAFT_557378 [Mycena galopus ATCC 62051]|nr:hypothetical protein K438DRAFT_557378 [Mycena galopus ATCC 62051]
MSTKQHANYDLPAPSYSASHSLLRVEHTRKSSHPGLDSNQRTHDYHKTVKKMHFRTRLHTTNYNGVGSIYLSMYLIQSSVRGSLVRSNPSTRSVGRSEVVVGTGHKRRRGGGVRGGRWRGKRPTTNAKPKKNSREKKIQKKRTKIPCRPPVHASSGRTSSRDRRQSSSSSSSTAKSAPPPPTPTETQSRAGRKEGRERADPGGEPASRLTSHQDQLGVVSSNRGLFLSSSFLPFLRSFGVVASSSSLPASPSIPSSSILLRPPPKFKVD